jgi:hypothetical protein
LVGVQRFPNNGVSEVLSAKTNSHSHKHSTINSPKCQELFSQMSTSFFSATGTAPNRFAFHTPFPESGIPHTGESGRTSGSFRFREKFESDWVPPLHGRDRKRRSPLQNSTPSLKGPSAHKNRRGAKWSLPLPEETRPEQLECQTVSIARTETNAGTRLASNCVP